MKLHGHRRTGFTLIELLVVIGILTLLATITMGGVFRARAARMHRESEQSLSKLQLALDQKWKATADQVNVAKAKRQIPAALMTYCGDDIDRAASLYMYALMRQRFPQTFAEAASPITIGTFTLQPLRTYSSVTAPARVTLEPESEAAALLYLILSETSVGGTAFNADDAMSSSVSNVVVRGLNCNVFTDAWKTPISFIRFAQSAELDGAPYVHTGVPAGNRDPLDPQRKLAGAWPATVPATNQASAAAALGLASFDGRNKQPTVYSAGPNRNYDPKNPPPLPTSPDPAVPLPPYWASNSPERLAPYDNDNLFGFRLRRQGDRGN